APETSLERRPRRRPRCAGYAGIRRAPSPHAGARSPRRPLRLYAPQIDPATAHPSGRRRFATARFGAGEGSHCSARLRSLGPFASVLLEAVSILTRSVSEDGPRLRFGLVCRVSKQPLPITSSTGLFYPARQPFTPPLAA